MAAGREVWEFFAGAGMARAGLGADWRVTFANDLCARKCASYAANWGAGGLVCGDVAALRPADLPGRAALAWASFPCQDLSLAGSGAGLDGARSGAFWPFWRLVGGLGPRRPATIALENVCGALTSRGGADFAALVGAFREAGYRAGALVIDAAWFVPQSRPRLFVIGARDDLPVPPALVADGPCAPWSSRALVAAQARAGDDGWIWWRLPAPAPRTLRLEDVLEDDPPDAPWRDAAQTARLTALMSRVNRARLAAAQAAGRRMVGAVYRRTRAAPGGGRAQRAEVRFDGLAGCLRTPAGGSSRQTLMVVEGARLRSRLLSAREAARLMGLPDDHRLPARFNEALHLLGDGVVVDVVRHLATHILAPLADAARGPGRRAA